MKRGDEHGKFCRAFAGECEDMERESPRLTGADAGELLKLCNQSVEWIHGALKIIVASRSVRRMVRVEVKEPDVLCVKVQFG